jgi:hypothetical protein
MHSDTLRSRDVLAGKSRDLVVWPSPKRCTLCDLSRSRVDVSERVGGDDVEREFSSLASHTVMVGTLAAALSPRIIPTLA